MICGSLDQWQRDRPYFPAAFDRAFAFLEGRDLASLAPGRHDIDGDALFALVQDLTTEDERQLRFEAHERYADLQFIVSGREKQLYAPGGADALLIEDLLAERDLAFYRRPAVCATLILHPGDYAVYLPGELHCPRCAVAFPGEPVRRIVFKIARMA